MFRVLVEYQGLWPEEGHMNIDGHFMDTAFAGVITISPTEAKRRVNHDLSRTIATGLFADNPVRVWNHTPFWRLSLSVRLPGLNTTEIPGVIDIDASTGEILPFQRAE